MRAELGMRGVRRKKKSPPSSFTSWTTSLSESGGLKELLTGVTRSAVAANPERAGNEAESLEKLRLNISHLARKTYQKKPASQGE